MRWLKALVIIMGVLIIVGVVIMIIGIGQKLSNNGANKQLDWSSVPPLSHIIDWMTIDDKIILVMQKPNEDILFYTLDNNQLKSGKPLEVPFSYQPKDDK